MMHTTKKAIRWISVMVLLVTLACGCNRIPDPTAPEVKQQVLSLSLGLIQDMALPEVAEQVTSTDRKTLLQYGFPPFEFKTWVAMRGESEQIAQVVAKIEEKSKNIDLRLENIRIESKDEKLRRVACQAELRVPNQEPLNIRYTAQYTEDGNLYVEVKLPK